ncbi:MAG TPA: nuclear transport factor 2 family protein [Methanoregula sp.]|nr:nuclear transport factor 2 family protein [Methanoregula sp.]
MTLNEAQTREVNDVMDQYVRYYNEKNEGNLQKLFSNEISGFGTAKNEIVGNFAQLKKLLRADLDPANDIRLNVKILTTGGVMPVAWITGLCNLDGRIGEKNINMEGRVTAVLVNQGGRWLFTQVHFSVPAE